MKLRWRRGNCFNFYELLHLIFRASELLVVAVVAKARFFNRFYAIAKSRAISHTREESISSFYSDRRRLA
jgi:hypothetical protein